MINAALFRAVSPEIPARSKWERYYNKAVEANWYTNYGPVNRELSERLEANYGRTNESVVLAANATSALSACLIAEGINGLVICPAFTFIATSSAIIGANCTPFIVDVDEKTGVVSPDVLETAIQISGARAAILVAPYGLKTDFRDHAEVCQRYGAMLVIDNAAGLGIPRTDFDETAPWENVREVFSLHATKPFGIGEGGAIFSPRFRQNQLKSALNFGIRDSLEVAEKQPSWGINGKLSEVHAAIGLAVADNMAERVHLRQSMAKRWMTALLDINVNIFTRDETAAPWQGMPILLETEEQVLSCIAAALAKGVELRRYYTPSLNRLSGVLKMSECVNAENLAKRALFLPIRSYLDESSQQYVIQEVCDAILESRQ